MTSQCLVYRRNTLCIQSSVSKRHDTDSENYSVVTRSIGSHLLKSTISRLIALMGLDLSPDSKTTLAQHWEFITIISAQRCSPMLAQYDFAHESNIGPTCWFHVGPM